MHLYNRFRSICFLFIIVSISGCAFTRDYPAGWPIIESDKSDCNNLDGNYKNTGDNYPDWDISLKNLLLPGTKGDADSISINWNNDKLNISAIKHGSLVTDASHIYKEQDYKCTKSGLELDVKSSFGGDSSLALKLYGSNVVILNRAKDKSLVLNPISSDFSRNPSIIVLSLNSNPSVVYSSFS